MYAKLKDQMKNRRLVSVSFLSNIYKRRSGLILHADNSNTINTCVKATFDLTVSVMKKIKHSRTLDDLCYILKTKLVKI